MKAMRSLHSKLSSFFSGICPDRTSGTTMDPRMWHKVAAVSGMTALALGTYGAHIFKPKNPAYKEVWHTASMYHLVHSAALLAAPSVKYPNIFGGFITAGILAFSGTFHTLTSLGVACVNLNREVAPSSCYHTLSLKCYVVALIEDKQYALLAPFGGFAFIAGWASLLF